jgi:hypothetical protein
MGSMALAFPRLPVNTYWTMAGTIAPTEKQLPPPALLWGSQTSAGRSGLTLKAIVTAAMDIADTEGVDALAMRNVAERKLSKMPGCDLPAGPGNSDWGNLVPERFPPAWAGVIWAGNH